MSFKVPTLDELTKRAQERHRSNLPGTDAFLWPNTEFVFIQSISGLVFEAFQYLDWIKRQRFALEADGDQLDEHGAQFNMTRKASSKAHGNLDIVGIPGTDILDGDEFARSDGARFVAVGDVTIQGIGNASIAVEAVEAGPLGNTPAGAELAATTTNTGIASIAVDDDGLGGGAYLEADEDYRARILARMRQPPQGGAYHDYIAWALSIAGVTRVWVDASGMGIGTVVLRFMADGNGNNGIPSDALVEDVAEYIDLVRPVTSDVYVVAPTPVVVDVAISGIGIPTETVRARIAAELQAVFTREVPISMASDPYTLNTNLLWAAVSYATSGGTKHYITTPAESVVIPVGSVAVLGDITYE